MSVWKFPFAITDKVTIQMPFGAEVLAVQVLGGTPCIWALVETANSNEPREFFITGTGHEVNSSWRHVATFQMPPFVWHMWER